MSQLNDEPSNLEKAKIFSKTAYDVIKGFVSKGTLLVPKEVKKARLDICRECIDLMNNVTYAESVGVS